MRVLFLCGNESNHNYFIDQIISHIHIDKYSILKVHSGISNTEYYTGIFKKDNMSTFERDYLLTFIQERNSGFSNYESMKFENESIVSNATEFNNKLDQITNNIVFDLYLAYGVPIIKNRTILNNYTKSVNLHFGLSRYHRGADTNIYALARNEFEKIGVTVHQIKKKVDSGKILFEVTLSEYVLKSLSTISGLNAKLLILAVSRLINVIKNNAFFYEKKDYGDSQLVLDSMVTIEDIIKAESNLKALRTATAPPLSITSN